MHMQAEAALPPPPPPPPPLLPPYLFTPSLHPPPPPPLLHQTLNPDIDWVSLLSGQPGTLPAENMILAEDEKGFMDNSKRNKGRSVKKASRPRFAFQTRSADDILDDGYRWRKYGQKAVKNSIYPRFLNFHYPKLFLFRKNNFLLHCFA